MSNAVYLPSDPVHSIIVSASDRYQIRHSLAFALSFHESGGFNVNALSQAGAIGLYQIMCINGYRCGYSCNELWDPANNADCGLQYLRSCLDATGDTWNALVAYNEGIGAWQSGARYSESVSLANIVTGLIPDFDSLLGEDSTPGSGPDIKVTSGIALVVIAVAFIVLS